MEVSVFLLQNKVQQGTKKKTFGGCDSLVDDGSGDDVDKQKAALAL